MYLEECHTSLSDPWDLRIQSYISVPVESVVSTKPVPAWFRIGSGGPSGTASPSPLLRSSNLRWCLRAEKRGTTSNKGVSVFGVGRPLCFAHGPRNIQGEYSAFQNGDRLFDRRSNRREPKPASVGEVVPRTRCNAHAARDGHRIVSGRGSRKA